MSVVSNQDVESAGLIDDDDVLQKTKAAITKIVNAKLRMEPLPTNNEANYIKYKPSSGTGERIMKLVEMPTDPLDLPKYNHKRLPKASGTQPVPVMQSPPPPVTVKDQQDWKIPPCISNWKNSKGYTIPLDKRLAADGSGLQDVQISPEFNNLAEALYFAEQKAREDVAIRTNLHNEIMAMEKERKEVELRELAQKARAAVQEARSQKACADSVGSGDYGSVKEREKIREERRRERERERNLEIKEYHVVGCKRKSTRDGDGDISEKVSLGMASTGGGSGGEVMYDERLFNQEKGMNTGFGTDDQYNVYDNGLFTSQNPFSILYRPKKDVDAELYGSANEQLKNISKTDRFKPDKSFIGTPVRAGPLDRPVEFDKDAQDSDLFGLDELWK